jgi:hypothetical protein
MNIISKTIKRNEVDYVFTLIEEPTVEMYNDALGTIFLLRSGVTSNDIENISALASDNWANMVNFQRTSKPDAKGNLTMRAKDFDEMKQRAFKLFEAANNTTEKAQYTIFHQVCELVNIFTVCEGVNSYTKKELIFGAKPDFILFFLKELKELLKILITFHFTDSANCLEIVEKVVELIIQNENN